MFAVLAATKLEREYELEQAAQEDVQLDEFLDQHSHITQEDLY